MTGRMDDLLGALRDQPADLPLDGLEGAVWSRIEAKRRAEAMGGGMRVQALAAAAALVVGVLVGNVAAERPSSRLSEVVVLSEDAGLAPSVVVEGGA